MAIVQWLSRPPGESTINAWSVRCPGIGWALMSLDTDGSLNVPRAIAPAPLPRIDGSGAVRRFGDGRVVVATDGTGVTWWPQGPDGPAVRCPSSAEQG